MDANVAYCRASFWEFMDGKITLAELERRMSEVMGRQLRITDIEKVLA
jgi:hypothetical protein